MHLSLQGSHEGRVQNGQIFHIVPLSQPLYSTLRFLICLSVESILQFVHYIFQSGQEFVFG